MAAGLAAAVGPQTVSAQNVSPNDMFADRIVIRWNLGAVHGSNFKATLEAGEPAFSRLTLVVPRSGELGPPQTTHGWTHWGVRLTPYCRSYGSQVSGLSLVVKQDDST
jgi:hypothetical protein